MKKISAQDAPQAIGPYSQAIEANGFVFLSGQIPLRADGSLIEGDVKEQTHQVLKNLGAVLAAANLKFSNVLKTTIYLANMDDFAVVNEVYSEYFHIDPKPARATVEVSKLPKGVAIEIDCVAVA